MFDWMKKHKKLIAFIIFMVIFGVPLIIHILFKLHPNIDFFVAEWTAGEILGYYGSILAFLGTVILGALSLYQNQIIKQESDKRAELLEQRERESNMPRFRFNFMINQRDNSKLKFNIENISSNVANNILLGPIQIVNEKKEVIWSNTGIIHIDTILSNQKREISLLNPPLPENHCCFKMSMQCQDKFADMHKYKVWAFCQFKTDTPHFQIEEIKNTETP